MLTAKGRVAEDNDVVLSFKHGCMRDSDTFEFCTSRQSF